MEKDEEYESLFKPHFRRSEVNVVRAVEERKYGYFINNIKGKEGIELYAEEKLVTKQKYKEMRCEMPGMSRSTFLMVFSADGTKVASTHGNHNIYVTDIRSGRNIRTLIGHPRTPWCIAFHPTSNQIVASGCLGGQVRIWDLSGGSEVWTARSTTVIASIAFHPSDRVLVIATYNEIYFWDWSKPEPFVHTSTSNPKEKVRYVAFDKLGHKLITGIANSPQSRWERVRAPVPVPRQAERSASPYRRRITPRLVNTTETAPVPANPPPREVQSGVPERERRITACYRNLVREYEQLVQRYLKLYRPPIMIDRGTDPMEANSTSTSSGTQTPEANRQESVPSPSSVVEDETQHHQTPPPIHHQTLIAPSRIISVLMNQRNQLRSLQQQQPQESRKHKAEEATPNETKEKRVKRAQLQPDDQQPSTSAGCTCQVKQSNEQQQDSATQTQSPRKVLVINTPNAASTSKVDVQPSTSRDTLDIQLDSTSNESNDRNVDDLLSNIRRTAEEEVRNRILPIIRSVPATDRPELIRLFENSRENVRMRFKEMCPQLLKKCIRGRLMISSSDSSSSDDETANTTSSSERAPPATNAVEKTTTRNYNTELERLVKTLLTEIERNDAETSTQATTTTTTTTSTSSTTNTDTATATVASTNEEDRAAGSNSSYPSSPLWRRRLFTHRVSAFMPTRVNYNRPTRLRRWCPNWSQSARSTPRPAANNTTERVNLDTDIDINDLLSRRTALQYSPPPQPAPPMTFHPFDPPPDIPTINPENIGIGNMYSNIVQDLESSLNDVRNINASNRPGETSDMLSSFSERLENILHQSDTILRNLRSSMDMLESRNTTPSTSSDSPQSPSTNTATNEPTLTFYDQTFYVRDQRNAAVAADHTYPRNPNTTPNDNMSPLMTSLHLTISHIQRQARLLRQQVESIERIDRALIEVAQLQLIRQMLVELVRYILHGEGRSTTGVSNVRQMMAGTRISDTSPPSEPADAEQPSTSAASTSTTESPAPQAPNRPRTSSRKTYPPSRFFKLKRQPRFTSLAHFVSRRYLNRSERNREHHRVVNASANIRDASTTAVTHSSLNLMSRRLERLLTDHMRPFTRPQDVPSTSTNRTTAYPSSYYSSATDLGEHVLALRLHGCVIRMNRILGTNSETNTIRNYLRTDTTAAVTHDGVSRIGCRHTLTLVIDSMSKQMEELGNMNLAPIFRLQIHSVLAMSLLLCELLLLQVVDSIPPPSGMNLDPERETLTSRINEMCGQMLQNRFSGQSHQLTRSLRLMRQTMRHAYTALGQTYTARRNAMMQQPDTDRRQLIGSINRCLRSINSRRGPNSTGESESGSAPEPAPSTSAAPAAATATTTSSSTYVDDTNMHDLLTTITDLIARHSSANGRGEEQSAGRSEHPQPSTSSQQDANHVSSDEDDNDDDDDDDWNSTSSTSNNYIRLNRNLYRTNNTCTNSMNSSSNSTTAPQQPTVRSTTLSPVQIQINDAPFSLMSRQQRIEHHQNFLAQRQRFAERVSELRSLPNTFYRPRFLHPFYSSSVNPFDADFDDPQQREQMYENDIITTVTPNHRIQAWDISNWTVPAISNSMKNIVVSECKIHNDASVDVASDGSILVTLLPSGGYLNVTNRLGIYSLRWETLGQCLYTTSFDQNAVSVSLSPLSRHLVVGLASRRFSIAPNDRWIMARVFKIEQKDEPGDRLPLVKELEQTRDSRINCIRWLPTSGQGLIYATNTGQLVVLT